MNKKKILITGFSGFVSRHLLAYMQENDHDVNVCGIDIKPPAFDLAAFPDNGHLPYGESAQDG